MRKEKVFDPHKVRPAEYRSRYPELKRISEFESISSVELQFVWYYANPTSDLMAITNEMERCQEALKRANYTPPKSLINDYLSLQFPENIAVAIDRMSRIEPGTRSKARGMIEKLLENYEDLCDKEQYADKDGIVNVKAYVDATTKIAQELPGLIAKMEEGFGITSKDEDADEQSVSFSRDWHQGQSEE